MKIITIFTLLIIGALIFTGITNNDVNASSALFKQSKDISSNLAVPEGLIFSPNGLKMYVVDNTGDLVEEYSLSTAWNIATAVHAGSNLAIADAQTDVPEDIAFNSDGSKMYLVDRDGDVILEYNLSTAYDVSTGAYQSGQNADVSGQTGNPEDISFNSDGSKMYVLENEGTDTVLEYALGAAFDVSDETYTDAFTIPVDGNGVDAFEFSSDGTKMFLADNSGITEFRLPTPWDVSTSVMVGQLNTGSIMGNPKGLAFSSDGLNLYITGTSKSVHQYTLGVAWDLFSQSKGSDKIRTFKPHIHDEVIVMINSEQKYNLDMNSKDIKKIISNVDDEINITISLGDDKRIDNIKQIKLITNFEDKPDNMNRYFITNYNNLGQVGLSIYEWNRNTKDIDFDYDSTISWNESTSIERERLLKNHNYVGPIPLKEKELIMTFSINTKKTMQETGVYVKVKDSDNMQLNTVLPFTLEILPKIKETHINEESTSPEDKINEITVEDNTKSYFNIKSNKNTYQNGEKLVITGNIPIEGFDLKNLKEIIFTITSPEKEIISTGKFIPQLDGKFSYETFTMDSRWRTDGEYNFNLMYGSKSSELIILYDNKEFKNIDSDIIEEKVIEETLIANTPVIETPITPEPTSQPIEEPVVNLTPETKPTLLGIASFVDQTKDPRQYIDRYNNEPVYKKWFNENYPQYSSIYQAVGLEEPIEEPEFTVKLEPPVLEETSKQNCVNGTELVNGICKVIQTEEKSSGGGCLIATATYGSELAPQVQQLRELRDNQLLQTESGTAFMGTFNDIYYTFSPIIADYERENPLFKQAVKLAITPMISTLSLMENAESESEVLSIGISVIVLNLVMYLGIPAIVVIARIKKRN